MEPALSAQHRDCVRGNCYGPNSILNTRSDPKGVDSVVDREAKQRGDEKCKNCVASSFVHDKCYSALEVQPCGTGLSVHSESNN